MQALIYSSMLMTLLLASLFPIDATAEFVVPIDGDQSYYCIWRDSQATWLANSSGKLVQFNIVNKQIKAQIERLKKTQHTTSSAKSQSVRGKILKLAKVNQGIEMCRRKKFGLEDGIPDLPVDPIDPVIASATLENSQLSLKCSISSYMIKTKVQGVATSGFILCQISRILPGNFGYSYSIRNTDVVQSATIYGSSRYANKPTTYLDTSFCHTIGMTPCANEYAYTFHEQARNAGLSLKISLGGTPEPLEGIIQCLVGCE